MMMITGPSRLEAQVSLNFNIVFENHQKCRIQYCELRSYVYILSGQKFNKNAKKGRFWRVFENLIAVKQRY